MASEFTGISWPGWEVVRKIGEGSFGGVYEIQRTLPGGKIEKCALKKLTVPRSDSEICDLYSQSYSKESITAHYKNQMSALVNEYSLVQSLGGCRNIVTCHDVRYIQHDDEIGWDIYIRMELLNPLKKVLSSTYHEKLVFCLARDMCDALITCQEHKIVHRDIKPENIMISDGGVFKLGDFGVAKGAESTALGTLTGTYGYMAPEVANRKPYGATADICSLGLVMYWLMNERTLPFLPLRGKSVPSSEQRQAAANRRFAGEPLPPPCHGSEGLKAIALKACAFAPEDRYQSALEMKRALAAWYQAMQEEATCIERKPPIFTPPAMKLTPLSATGTDGGSAPAEESLSTLRHLPEHWTVPQPLHESYSVREKTDSLVVPPMTE